MSEYVCELHSPRLILREWNELDLDDFYEYASVDGVGEMAGWRHHESKEESVRILFDFMENEEFAIELKENHKVIGSIGLHKPRCIPRDCKKKKGLELGYVVSKDYQGLGYATEAVREMIRYLFLQCDIEYLVIGYYKRNLKSKRIAEKCRFSYFTDFEFHTFFNTIEDSEMTYLKKEDYFTKDEYYQVYDSDMLEVDLKIKRPDYVPDGFYFGIVDVITYNTKNKSFLITRRDRNKPTLPLMLECTCGCMQYHENELYSAKRELEEETGITNATFIPLKKFIYRHAVAHMYVAICDIDPDSIVLQKGETEAYYWYTKEEFIELWNSNQVTEVQKGRIFPILNQIIEVVSC